MRRTHPLPKVRHLTLEGLETRNVLSGTVSAVIDASGTLVVTGDDLANNIVISAGPNAGEVIVFGGRAGAQAGTETRVNGALEPATLSGFGGEVRLNMQGGYDQVVVTNLALEGSLQAFLGAGNDRLSLQSHSSSATNVRLNDGSAIATGPVRLGVFVSVNGGDGDDLITTSNTTVDGYLAFTAGAGNDTFAQSGAGFASNSVGGALTLNMEAGADIVQINYLNVGADLTLDDSAGSDANVNIRIANVAGTARIRTPNGSDSITIGTSGVASSFVSTRLIVNAAQGYDNITIRNASTHDLIVNAGSGNNTITLSSVTARESLTLTAGDGSDQVSLTAVVTDILVIRTWHGNDAVKLVDVSATDALFDLFDGADELDLRSSIFASLLAEFGFDDDKLVFGDLTVVETAEFDGGDGINTHTNLGGNNISRLKLIAF